MGHCTSKEKHPGHSLRSDPKPAPRHQVVGRQQHQQSRTTKTSSRPTPTRPSETARALGTETGDSNGAALNAKEALARAAEERFKRMQEEREGQKERLRQKAKLSRAEKGL